MQFKQQIIIIFNFVDTPRNFIIAKLSIRKPGSSSVLTKSRNIKKGHSRVFLSAFFSHIMRMRKSLASVERIFYIERYGEIRIFAKQNFSQMGWTIGRWFTTLENKVIVNILSLKWTLNYCLVAAKTKKNNPEEWVAMTFCCVLLLKLPMKPTDVYKCPKHLQ